MVAVALVIGGCATPGKPGVDVPVGPERAKQATRSINLSGFPPDYQRGFTDGCAEAGTAAKPKPTGTNGQFQMGWNDGLSYCRRNPPK
jgi:hypothetical protein